MRAAPTLVVGLVIPLAGCGGSDTAVDTTTNSASTTEGVISAAAKETLDAGTAKVVLVTEHTRSNATWGIEAGERETAEGAVEFDLHRVAVDRGSGKHVFDGATYYFRDEYEPDRRWRKYDLDEPSSEVGSGFIRRFDPVYLLSFVSSVRDFGARVAVVGRKQLRGVATTHYSARVGNEELAQAFLPGMTYEEFIRSRAYPEPIEPDALFEAWVGDDGRLYKVLYDFRPFEDLLGERTIVELYDFGAAVDIDLPSPSEMVDG